MKNLENANHIQTIAKDLNYLEADRVTLIKRITNLTTELDKLTLEKNDLLNALREERIRSSEYERQLRQSGKYRKIADKSISSDLAYEKEENMRLRNLLHSMENE